MARLLAVLAVVVVAVPSVAVADNGSAVPARPTGLRVATEAGSLEVLVGWDRTDGATSYLVRWRSAGPGHKLNEGTQLAASEAAVTADDQAEWLLRGHKPGTAPVVGARVTMEDFGEWVVRIEACNDAGCGLGTAERFKLEAASGQASDSASGQASDSVSDQVSDFVSDQASESTPEPTSQAASDPPPTTTTAPTTTTTTTTTTTVPVQSVPDRPGTLTVATTAGSLDATVDWDDVDGAASYLVRWRQTGPEHRLNDGVTVQTSSATVTVDSYGEWVVRVEACNDAGCGPHRNRRFTVRAANRAPVVNADADNYATFTGTHNAARGTLVYKHFGGIFSDPDGDTLTYTVSVPDDRTNLVEVVGVHQSQQFVGLEHDDEDDWKNAVAAIPNPLSTEVTLTATDPGGLSVTLKGTFKATWESHPKLRFADAYVVVYELLDPSAQGDGELPPDTAEVVLTFDQDLQTSPLPAASQFTVKVFNQDESAAGTIAVSSVAITGKKVSLELASAPQAGQYLTLGYTHNDDKPIKRAAAGGDSAPGFTGRSVWMLFATSEPPTQRDALIDRQGGGTPATLVSNTNQTESADRLLNSYDYAQRFTTGSSSGGYKLTSVQLLLRVGNHPAGDVYPTLSVNICPEVSGLPSTSCLGTLTSPALVPATPSGVFTFMTSDAGVILAADTNYFVVIDTTAVPSNSRAVLIKVTDDDTEDAGAATGWSIADGAWERSRKASDWSNPSQRGRAAMIAIDGYAVHDYDTDNDGLIEISTADQLNAIRWDTDGDGTPTDDPTTTADDETESYYAAFPSPLPRMGCPASGCRGYEIGTGAAGEAAITIALNVAPYNTGDGWVPIPEFTATLDGNGNTVNDLTRSSTAQLSNVGLFHTIGRTGVVRNLGVTEALARGVTTIGALAANNEGLILASYSTGVVDDVTSPVNREEYGGLVGVNHASGRIYASYSEALVRISASGSPKNVGGLVGVNHGTIVASYAEGATESTNLASSVNGFGGLVGRNHGRIHASYATGGGAILGTGTDISGLVGAAEEGSSVTASYWDTQTSGRSVSAGGEGKTTAELKLPTGYSGIYAGWNVDLNRDGIGDDPWDFGTTSQYPQLRIPLRLAFVASPCHEDITIRDWRDLHYHRYKWSTGIVRPWPEGCGSYYYTFTLDEETQVRLHAQGRSSANLWLREGVAYAGDTLAESSRYGYNSQAARIEEILPAGTYTLETAGAHTLWAGTITSLPPMSAAGSGGVSNLGQSTHATTTSSEWDYAQAFTTGPHPDGYRITSVAVELLVQGTQHPVYEVKIHPVNSSGQPTGSSLGTFANPASLTTGTNTFTSSGDVQLQPSTQYALVFDLTTAGGNNGQDVVFRYTDTGAEDAGAADGWSIADNSFRGSSGVTLNVNTNQPEELKISILASAGCSAAIAPGQSHAKRWDAECLSVSNPGPHAAYYVYTPESSRFVEVTLTSPDAEEHMYLWEDGRQVREAGSSGHKYAEMSWLAYAGRTYVLEVTADAPSAQGRYLVAMHNGGGEPTAPPAECWETVVVEGGGPGARPNGWTFGNNAGRNRFEWPCHSVQRPAAYAHYFTFELSAAREVRMELYGSQAAGADMFLREGDRNFSGPYVAESHFPGIGPVRARLDLDLKANTTYTIEAVASSPGNGGHFDLVIKEPPPRFTPSDDCRKDLGDITYVGVHSDSYSEEWGASGCGTFSRSGAYARFFRFELTHTVKLAFALNGGPDSRIYLYKGAEFRDSDLIEDDLSFIEQNLAPGTYTVEVTTLYGDGRSDDDYTFSYRRTGPAPPEPDTPSGTPTQGNIWEATLTVQAPDYPEGFLGCWSSCSAALADNGQGEGHRFAFGDTWYEVRVVGVTDSGSFRFQVKGVLSPIGSPRNKWTLHVGNQQFTLGWGGSWSWGGRGEDLGWTEGDTINLRLHKAS